MWANQTDTARVLYELEPQSLMLQHWAPALQMRGRLRLGGRSGCPTERMNLEGIRVLLVEDNPGDARLLREAVAAADTGRVRLDHVERLDQALDRLSSEHFDVVLLDLNLPDEEGLETAIPAHAPSPAVPTSCLPCPHQWTLAGKAPR